MRRRRPLLDAGALDVAVRGGRRTRGRSVEEAARCVEEVACGAAARGCDGAWRRPRWSGLGLGVDRWSLEWGSPGVEAEWGHGPWGIPGRPGRFRAYSCFAGQAEPPAGLGVGLRHGLVLRARLAWAR